MTEHAESKTRWFCANGAVREREDGVFEVTAGGVLIGFFEKGDAARRDLLLIALADNPVVELNRLAWAFQMTPERLRQIRKFVAEKGPDALFDRPGRGRKGLSPRARRRVEKLFDAGLTIDGAYAKVKRSMSRASVGRIHKAWAARKQEGDERSEPSQQQPKQQELFVDDGAPVARRAARPKAREAECGDRQPTATSNGVTSLSLPEAVERGGANVQHLGTWLMLGKLHAAGLYDTAERLRRAPGDPGSLRLGLDAAAIALALGQRCVEGVRRLATTSAPTLLRCSRSPSANWTRQKLHAFAADGAVTLHLAEASRHTRWLATEGRSTLDFYVDNHLRPYSGHHTIRKGWRMQDKRAVPGCTDYHVHDAAGRPVMRMDCPDHSSLVEIAPRLGQFLQNQVGEDTRIRLVFDRAGAFPQHLAGLRDAGLELVTYERKPYPIRATSEFKKTLTYRGETLRWVEAARKNLRLGRGRVRRIFFLTPDDVQISILAVSDAPAPDLILALLNRWARQENQFKHGKERWGINQLDGRRVEPYPEEAVIPNPARRRLERELRVARDDEAAALRRLAHLPDGHKDRVMLQNTAAAAFQRQCDLQERRASTPTHAPLSATELSGKLVKHTGRYKVVVDTLRVVLANAEADLANSLAAYLRRPREAKKMLANLLAAPGKVRIGSRNTNVALKPAGTKRELEAFRLLLRDVNRCRLVLPGDPDGRPLRFTIANS